MISSGDRTFEELLRFIFGGFKAYCRRYCRRDVAGDARATSNPTICLVCKYIFAVTEIALLLWKMLIPVNYSSLFAYVC